MDSALRSGIANDYFTSYDELLKERICFERSKFFRFSVGSFLEVDWCTGKQIGSHKSCLPRKIWGTIYQSFQDIKEDMKNKLICCGGYQVVLVQVKGTRCTW